MTRSASLKVIVPLLAAVIAAALVVWLRAPTEQPIAGGDPADRFELVKTALDSEGTKYAAVYRYYHANSSSTVTAVWILPGSPPSIGSTLPVAGEPVMAFTGSPDAVRVRWPQEGDKLVVEVDGTTDTKTGPEAFEDCYFAESKARNLACYDDKKIQLR
ncbi:MAG: hypothetical protein ACXWJW_09495 [Xanthobacteraceae bacterium]